MTVGRYRFILAVWAGGAVFAHGTQLATAETTSKPLQILICYPAGPVRARDAKPTMDSMLRVIEETGQWHQGALRSRFTSKVDECRRLLKKLNPHFAILSVGLFLEHQEQHNLVPVAQPSIQGKTTDAYRILAKKGKYSSLDELEGKTLGGTHLTEPVFLKKIVFRNQLDPEKYFQLKPSRRSLRALRQLNLGKLDAVMVNQQQYQSLGSLSFSKELTGVFSSDPIPLVGLVANLKKTSQNERDRLTQALSLMCTHKIGKELCQLFGVEAFLPATQDAYKQVMQRWHSR